MATPKAAAPAASTGGVSKIAGFIGIGVLALIGLMIFMGIMQFLHERLIMPYPNNGNGGIGSYSQPAQAPASVNREIMRRTFE